MFQHTQSHTHTRAQTHTYPCAYTHTHTYETHTALVRESHHSLFTPEQKASTDSQGTGEVVLLGVKHTAH